MSESSGIAALHPGVQYHLANTLRWPDLRPLQRLAVEPILAGDDCLLLAPTAGGKTEAAMLPLLTRMADQEWRDVSVLYVCPLRALLNNLEPRLRTYTEWLGRSAQLWHGDTSQTQRQRILRERPDVLLTTPESLEAMLVSTKVDTDMIFGGLQAVVVDEVHAFAGDDRGWHLLAVLERLENIAGRPIQRIGLSATIGNPDDLLSWLQGSHSERGRRVISPPISANGPPPPTDITLDFVGSISNAAKVIASLHQGEKRLVFVDSRRRAEELGEALRGHDVQTYVSHSSLSAAERRRSEEAFADARDTVIVATSTLELGIDVGDLDRVIQIDAPRTVASFLQRIGRTGRRKGSHRNCLFLCLNKDAVLHAAGLLERWAAGWVEPVVAPPSPRHIAAQQLMALALQEHRIGANTWLEWWGALPLFDECGDAIVQHLRRQGFFESDGDFLFIGPEAERQFGRRYFSDLTSVFTAAPEFTVLHGRHVVGTVPDEVLVAKLDGPRVLLLAGHSWQVTNIDWQRRRCWVEPSDTRGRAKWSGVGGGLSADLAQGMRRVVLGYNPPGVSLTQRAQSQLAELRDELSGCVATNARVIRRDPSGDLHWYTWAGSAANRTLQASLKGVADPRQRIGDRALRLLPNLSFREISDAIANAVLIAPEADQRATSGLKFAAALPTDLAQQTLADRLIDRDGADHALRQPLKFVAEA